MDVSMLVRDSVMLLRQMIRIPSPSFKEAAVSDAIAAFLQDKGIVFSRLYNNIIVLNKHYCHTKKTLLLCAHIDTVPPVEGYDFDPYMPTDSSLSDIFASSVNTDAIVAGLGANDDGASVVALIAVFRYFYEQVLPVNLLLVLSAEEERSGRNGMAAVWAAMEHGMIDDMTLSVPDYAIIGEPTEMLVAQGERGLLVFDGVAHGVSGHVAQGEGVNAIYTALHDIHTLTTYPFERLSPLFGAVTLSVTQIEGGTAHNVIPDRCSFVVDIRTTEQYTNEELLRMLQAVCNSTLTPRNLLNHTSYTAPQSPLLYTAKRLGIPTFISPTTSDWLRIHCDAIKMGPGVSSRSHCKNEYITLSELSDGIEQYITFINTFFKHIDYDDTME